MAPQLPYLRVRQVLLPIRHLSLCLTTKKGHPGPSWANSARCGLIGCGLEAKLVSPVSTAVILYVLCKMSFKSLKFHQWWYIRVGLERTTCGFIRGLICLFPVDESNMDSFKTCWCLVFTNLQQQLMLCYYVFLCWKQFHYRKNFDIAFG